MKIQNINIQFVSGAEDIAWASVRKKSRCFKPAGAWASHWAKGLEFGLHNFKNKFKSIMP